MNWEIVASVVVAIIAVGIWSAPRFAEQFREMRRHDHAVAEQKRLAEKYRNEAYRRHAARMAGKRIDK